MSTCRSVLLTVSLTLCVVYLLSGDPYVAHPTVTDLVLGTGGYAPKVLLAPTANGLFLRAFDVVLTKLPIGHLIRRHLLNGNGIIKLRELAAQMPDTQPMLNPFLRLDSAARLAHEEEAQRAAADHLSAETVLKEGFASPTGSHIEAYYKAFKSGQTDPVQAAKRVLEAANRLQSTFVAFAELQEEQVLLQAEASAKRWKSSSGPLSIFDGVPIAVKDMVDTKGHLTSHGSAAFLSNGKAAGDDPIVARFRELGAIILGTTVMTEGGVTPLGYNVLFGGPFNPYNASHYSGGSSSGSAVAVALGLCPVAVGFDGGGSIRIPSSHSGIVGLATGFGRIDFTEGIAISTVKGGPMTSTVADAAIAMAAMTKPSEPQHQHFARLYDGGSDAGLPTFHLGGFFKTDRLDGVRLGIFQPWFDDCTPSVRAAAQAAVDQLVQLGATIVPFELAHMDHLRLSHGIKILSEFGSAWDVKFSAGMPMEPNTRITVALGHSVSGVEIIAADKLRAWTFDQIQALFEKQNVTAIVTPTVALSAPVIPREALEFGTSNTNLVGEHMKFIFLANLIGNPGITVPIGHDSTNDNMPIGLHFMGQHWREHDLLRLARATEGIRQGDVHHPSAYVPIETILKASL